jgi:hypothetical protein
MPEKGYRSITVKQDVYDFLMKEYKKKKKDWLVKHGISSFTGYINYRLNELRTLDKQRTQKP